MKSHSKDAFAQLFWFFVTAGMVSYNTPFGEYAIVVAALLWGVWSLAIRFASHAIFRLGGRAWWLLAQLTTLFGLFLWFAPLNPAQKILTVWGIGVPVMLLSAVARRAYEAWPGAQGWFSYVPTMLAAKALFTIPLWTWQQGHGLGTGLVAALLTVVFASVPAYFGWELAARRRRGAADARFGSDETFRQAGQSDER